VIVDTSAIIAIIANDPERPALLQAMLDSPSVRMSAGSLLETSIVVDRLGDPVASRRLDDLLAALGVEVVEMTREQAEIGRAAYRDFGKGSGHPAGLNLGDCFAYALARQTREPLLFKGEDFAHTDVTSAL
jgi:ribonuclease VapC